MITIIKNGVAVIPPNPIHGWIQPMSNSARDRQPRIFCGSGEADTERTAGPRVAGPAPDDADRRRRRTSAEDRKHFDRRQRDRLKRQQADVRGWSNIRSECRRKYSSGHGDHPARSERCR